MSLLETWRNEAYFAEKDQRASDMFWANYFNFEKAIYDELLATPDVVIEGTVKELASKFNVDLMVMVGFLDGINESLTNQNPLETMQEDTVVNLGFDLELLYKNMVEAKADWLYGLEKWDSLISEDRRKELYLEQKKSNTVVKDKKVGRNEPCTCGSGKKYKKCCGK